MYSLQPKGEKEKGTLTHLGGRTCRRRWLTGGEGGRLVAENGINDVEWGGNCGLI